MGEITFEQDDNVSQCPMYMYCFVLLWF